MLLQFGGSDLKLPTQRWRNIICWYFRRQKVLLSAISYQYQLFLYFASLYVSPVQKLRFGPGCPMESVQKVRKLLIPQLWTSLGRHRDRSLTSGGKKISFLARKKVFMIRRSKHIDLISVSQGQRQIFCQLSSRNINLVYPASCGSWLPYSTYLFHDKTIRTQQGNLLVLRQLSSLCLPLSVSACFILQ